MHVAWQIVDEAQEMTEAAWGELYQALNGGGRRWVYGVPNGLRNLVPSHDANGGRGTVQLAVVAESRVHAREGRRTRAAVRRPGARPAMCTGCSAQHGEPMHAAFSLDDYLECVDEGVTFDNVYLEEDDDFIVPREVPKGDYYLGCDLGYSRDPSEFVVYRVAEPHLVNVLRVHMRGRQLRPAAGDHRGAGQGLSLSRHRRRFRKQRPGRRPQPHGAGPFLVREGARLRVRRERGNRAVAGRFHASAAREAVHDRNPATPDGGTQHRISPRLADRETQYASHTYTVTANGEIVYEKGNDHLIDADRCAVLCHYQDTHDHAEPVFLGVRPGRVLA